MVCRFPTRTSPAILARKSIRKISTRSKCSAAATPPIMATGRTASSTWRRAPASRRNNEAELVLSAGNFYQTDDQLNFGGHTNNFAYYASVNGNRTNLGLQTPTSAVIHDAANGFGGFTSLMYNLDRQRSIARRRASPARFLSGSVRSQRSRHAGQFLKDANRENDSFVTFSWVRTFNPGLLLTVSPFFHYNSANYEEQPARSCRVPRREDRSSKYEGGQATHRLGEGSQQSARAASTASRSKTRNSSA